MVRDRARRDRPGWGPCEAARSVGGRSMTAQNVDYFERLRRLAINDAHLAEDLMGSSGVEAGSTLDPKTLTLVRLAALVADPRRPAFLRCADRRRAWRRGRPPTRSWTSLARCCAGRRPSVRRGRGTEGRDRARVRHRRGAGGIARHADRRSAAQQADSWWRADRLASRRDTELAIDRSDLRPNGVVRNEQTTGDLTAT